MVGLLFTVSTSLVPRTSRSPRFRRHPQPLFKARRPGASHPRRRQSPGVCAPAVSSVGKSPSRPRLRHCGPSSVPVRPDGPSCPPRPSPPFPNPAASGPRGPSPGGSPRLWGRYAGGCSWLRPRPRARPAPARQSGCRSHYFRWTYFSLSVESSMYLVYRGGGRARGRWPCPDARSRGRCVSAVAAAAAAQGRGACCPAATRRRLSSGRDRDGPRSERDRGGRPLLPVGGDGAVLGGEVTPLTYVWRRRSPSALPRVPASAGSRV